jgi:hypothetical protein
VITGIEIGTGGIHLLVFPNPASGTAFVQLANSDILPCDLRITDLRGRLLFQQHNVDLSTKFEIDLHDFAAGTYIVEVAQNGIRRTVRLAIQ